LRRQALHEAITASGFSQPVAFVQDPTDRATQFIVEQNGRIRVLRGASVLSQDFLDLSASIVAGGEQGLLGLAFPPDAAVSRPPRVTQRLADFASEHLVAHVLGTHIEQKNLPYLDFGRGTIWQRDESPLELTRAHVFELNDAFISLHGENKVYAAPDFTLVPRGTAETSYPPELRPPPAKTN